MGAPRTTNADGQPPIKRGRRELRTEVGQAREQYIRWLLVTRDLSPHTIRAYDSDIAAFERHLGAEASIAQIDRDRIVAFVEGQRDAGLSAMSIRRRASGLRGFCKWLRSSRLLNVDPWANTSVAVGRSRKLPRIVSTHDLDRLFRFLQSAANVGNARDTNAVLE
jgi:integrase/recombinase XerC